MIGEKAERKESKGGGRGESGQSDGKEAAGGMRGRKKRKEGTGNRI